MKKWKMVLTAAMPLAMALSFPAFAGEWHEDMNGWWYENDDGSYCRNGWYWIDGNHDGWAECYYFGNNGYMVTNPGNAQTNTAHADGYEIDKNGAWSVNGVTQVKAVPTAVEENDPEALEVYEEAQQLSESLSSANIDVDYTITMSYLGQDIDMSMDLNLMMKEGDNGAVQFVCKGNADMLGTAVPINMFYTDGYMYMDTMGMKYKQAMDLETARAQATQIDMNMDTDVVKGLRMYTNGDTRKLAFTIDDEKINEILNAVTGATAATYEELGVSMGMKVNEANGEMTVNKDGYCEVMKMFMDFGMSITDNATSEVDDMNYKMDMNMTYKNPGKEVYFEIPSTDGYADISEVMFATTEE